jgi:hypothetical protein
MTLNPVGKPLILLTATFLLVGCFSSKPIIMPAGSSNPSLGIMAVSSPQFGHVSLEPTSCTAGDREFFLGGDFEDPKTGLVVRLVVDPLGGAAARVFSSAKPMDTSLVFRRSDCRAFHFTLDSTGWRINEIRDYRLSLELDCSVGDASIQGSVSSTHCH